MNAAAPYNPLDKGNLGASVAQALLARKPCSLGDLPSFAGAGIYAIYYTGDLEPYRAISAANSLTDPMVPIYVGKAVPAGGRKGVDVAGPSSTKALHKRLSEHRESISAATNLSVDDFLCRFLVVDDIWIPLGESLLITKFAPLWNSLIDGFGNHDPGKGRYNGMRSKWDVLHPGRAWASKCAPRPETATQIQREVAAHLAAMTGLPPPRFHAEQPRAAYRVKQGTR
mgnify:CR=1 FL=1